jgi:choice-of-anchor C domain-containing protein
MQKSLLRGITILMVVGFVWVSRPPAAQAQTVGPSVVKNGSFENPHIVDPFPRGVIFDAGSRIGPWTVTRGSVQLLGDQFQPKFGRQSLDLSGNERGSISQDLNTVPGSFYKLRFFLAGNPDGPPRIKKVRVFWGARELGTFPFDTFEKTRDRMGYEIVELRVRATAETTQLRFVGVTRSNFGAVIDGVRVIVDN